jgi:cytochrome c peroxidase
MYGDAPVELGLKSQSQIEERLRDAPEYQPRFAEAFPDDEPPLTARNVARALAAFERVLISGRSPYDRYAYDGDDSALDDAAKRGYELFFGEKLECFHCHAGFDFSDHVHYANKPQIELHYHNTGLYNIDGKGSYPEPNTGVYNVTQDPRDMGFFKAPTLRNIAVTAPYMHDGSIAALSEVLDHYAAGGRTIASGRYAGVGKNSPLKDKLVRGFELSERERSDVIAFLESLTDHEFLTNPAFSDPNP